MSSSRFHRLFRTLSFRLTLWYAGIAAVSACVAFLVLYLIVFSTIRERADQHLLNESTEFSSLYASKGLDAVTAAIVLEAESDGVNQVFLRILRPEGQELFTSNLSSRADTGISRAALKRLAEGEGHVFETLSMAHQTHTVRIIYRPLGPEAILQMGISSEDDDQFLAALRQVFVVPMFILLVFSALLGWFMARRALRGVEEVTRTATEISAGAFDRRVPLMAREEEIDRLARAFNGMLDRIEALVSGMRQVTDNIAHDLRSPIARIRGMAEIALTSGQAEGDSALMAASAIEDCDRLLGMVNTMLDISEAEAGASQVLAEELDLVRIVRDACDLFLPVAEAKGLTIDSHLPDSLCLKGDLSRLQRMVANLLDNALKYTPPGGKVTVAARKEEGRIVLSLTDTGIGISQEDITHIFDRFYRCDHSRSSPGVGLGLSLARAIAHAHNGDIDVTSNPGSGSTFTVSLPAE